MSIQTSRILGSEEASLRILVEQQKYNRVGTATLNHSRRIVLSIQGYSEYIRINEGTEYELGRYKTARENYFNLSMYAGPEFGISRQHAKLFLINGHLYIVDMNSTNGTYLRGSKLRPEEPTMLYNGEEVYLGRLLIKIEF